jgi:hypothetical protein
MQSKYLLCALREQRAPLKSHTVLVVVLKDICSLNADSIQQRPIIAAAAGRQTQQSPGRQSHRHRWSRRRLRVANDNAKSVPEDHHSEIAIGIVITPLEATATGDTTHAAATETGIFAPGPIEARIAGRAAVTGTGKAVADAGTAAS